VAIVAVQAKLHGNCSSLSNVRCADAKIGRFWPQPAVPPAPTSIALRLSAGGIQYRNGDWLQ
jgi:hypothetical protein